jgi:4-amino-4-deoxy-L-arabinose transferase-like glycosyltransferase
VAEWVLLGLIVAGVVLRIVAMASFWPATTTLSDAISYSSHAEHDVLGSAQHPPGYSIFLATIGLFSREVAVTIAIQHVLGIVGALALYAGVRRVCGSPWPALAGAAVVLLDGDLIYLEQSIMAEGPFTALLCWSVYATVRAFDSPQPEWRWPLIAGLSLGMATVARSAALFVIPVAALAFWLALARPWRERLRPLGALAGAAVAVLLVLAVTNKIHNDRFEIGPAQGWHLYQRVAPFADCSRFDPPPGTEALCEDKPAAARLGGDFYMYDPRSPAVRAFGGLGNDDAKLGAWARAAILAQPRDYLQAAWRDLRAYWVPSSHLYVDGAGGDLDPQLDWEITLPPDSRFDARTKRVTEAGMEEFFNDFEVDQWRGGILFMDTEQRVTRFGGTLLSVSTFFIILGLLIGSRRQRIGVLLYGFGGLAMLVAPTFSAIYIGRYTVPGAGLVAAGAGIAVLSLVRGERVARARSARA